MELVVDVEKGAYESVVCHRVGDAFRDHSEVECLVPSANQVVLKAQVDMAHIDTKVLYDNLRHAAEKARLFVAVLA